MANVNRTSYPVAVTDFDVATFMQMHGLTCAGWLADKADRVRRALSALDRFAAARGMKWHFTGDGITVVDRAGQFGPLEISPGYGALDAMLYDLRPGHIKKALESALGELDLVPTSRARQHLPQLFGARQ